MKKITSSILLTSLHRLHFLMYPFYITSIYFFVRSLIFAEKVTRATTLGHGLLFLGFALGLQTLKKDSKGLNVDVKKYILQTITYLVLAISLLILAIIIFLTKSDGIEDPVGLGLCSVAVGLFGFAKERIDIIKTTVA